MNIFKTFEIFLREPLSIFRDKFIQIVNVSSVGAASSGLNVDIAGQKAQITVINNDKVYKLLKTVQYKQKENEANKKLSNNSSTQIVIGHLFGRM